MAANPTQTLQQQLDEITAHTRALVPADRLARTDEVVCDLRATAIESHSLPVGSSAPEFSLMAANGKLVRSADLLAIGSLVIKFFRGRWCPYDMTELEAWQLLQPELRSRRALFVAISPQTPRQNGFTALHQSKPGGLTFPLLSDPACGLAEQFGIAYTVPEPTQRWYRSMLVNVPLLNGDATWRLPLPGIFVVAPNGTVRYGEAHADHRLRADPAAVLAMLS